MTRNIVDGPLVSVRAELLGRDDDESWFDLGEIQPLGDDELDHEPVLAQGSDIHRLDADRPAEQVELDQALVAYLLDLEATHV
ncbi:MAG TPA: hypothetical protein VM261_15890 [Kofleriaceae bacterium]|nr:hypothetical protein [Kofleriaceae bacterium]